jgi:hypothetical protein
MDQGASEAFSSRGIHLFQLLQEGNGQGYLLQPSKPTSGPPDPVNSIAVVNKQESNILLQLAHRLCFFEAYSATDTWASVSDGKTVIEKDTYELVDIIIYGPNQTAEEIGTFLDSEGIFLQEPDYQDISYGYNNPHFLDLNVDHAGLDKQTNIPEPMPVQALDGLSTKNLNDELSSRALLKKKLETAFTRTTRAQNLHCIKVDGGRVRTPLKS